MDGSTLSLIWGVPFAGLLLTIAILPILAPHFWHAHYGKVTLGWVYVLVLPCFAAFGMHVTEGALLHSIVLDFLPFIIQIATIFVITGGIRLTGRLAHGVKTNVMLLGAGTLLAATIGTTGASMLLVRPLLRVNEERKHQAHPMIFLIFLAGNIGGLLTPLGNPPLFIGFLHGVSFFWPLTHLFLHWLFACGFVLTIFAVLDWHLWKSEPLYAKAIEYDEPRKVRLEGRTNIILLGVTILTVLVFAIWKTEAGIAILGVDVPLPLFMENILFLFYIVASLLLTPRELREHNNFHWGPVLEVGKLFAGIFVTIVPVLHILEASTEGALANVIRMVENSEGANNRAYFWVTGLLSSFLDNAPTYLVFFQTAGGNAARLMTEGSTTLIAISVGAVMMGANSYIGNAPNFMIKAIAEDGGVKMPSFFAYMAWSGAILMPLYMMVTFLFF